MCMKLQRRVSSQCLIKCQEKEVEQLEEVETLEEVNILIGQLSFAQNVEDNAEQNVIVNT